MKQTVQRAFTKQFPHIWLGSQFKDWFSDMPFNPKAKVAELHSQKLLRPMNDQEIFKEFNPSEVSIEEIAATLKTMDHDWWAIFYAKDKDGELRAVFVYWYGGGWDVEAHSVLNPFRWSDGDRFFSRNSCPLATLSSSDPLALGTLESRVKALEEWKAKVEKMLRID